MLAIVSLKYKKIFWDFFERKKNVQSKISEKNAFYSIMVRGEKWG